MPRTLIAGFGNVLQGDDGFGVEVVRQLGAHRGRDASEVRLLEVGTGGIRLAQELLAGYDRLIIVDAMARGGVPGSLYVVEVEGVEVAEHIDMHLAVPARALAVAKALGALPSRVFMVGCEPGDLCQPSLDLTTPVRNAVDQAIHHIHALLAKDGAEA